MDLNIYNINLMLGLFGRPKQIHYFPNIDRGIDTSGIAIMDFESFKAACIAAKDCKAPASVMIQGDKGYIMSLFLNIKTNDAPMIVQAKIKDIPNIAFPVFVMIIPISLDIIMDMFHNYLIFS